MKPTPTTSGAAISGAIMADSDRRMQCSGWQSASEIYRAIRTLISSLMISGLFIWLNWEASSFACSELKQLPYSRRRM
jgi:hypothetical protein